jgi:hypothetical protein
LPTPVCEARGDKPPAREKRAGLTLLEVLVILAVLGMLLALLAMYLPRAAESKRRMRCLDRQRQLGAAVLAYHQTHGAFPGYRQPVAERCPSWVAPLLPQLGQRGLYDDWTSEAEGAAPPAPHLYRLICPSAPPETVEGPKSSYVVNAGRAGGNTLATGVFFDHCVADPAKRLEMTLAYLAARDGAGRTFMLSERREPAVWSALHPPAAEVGFLWRAEGLSRDRPSSHHVRGFNVLYCDGRGEFMSDDIDARVYRLLMTPDSEAALADEAPRR